METAVLTVLESERLPQGRWARPPSAKQDRDQGPRYFYGHVIGVGDLEQEQLYHREKGVATTNFSMVGESSTASRCVRARRDLER
jgi:hypothetical protein